MQIFRVIALLGGVLLSSFALNAQQTLVDTILHNGILRNYRLYIPASFNANSPAPLVFNLHGYSSNALEQQFYSEMDRVADTANFLVCYPNGVANAWNVGWAFGSTADDVGFMDTLIEVIRASYNIDTTRLYTCGMSNGGFMSYRLACERSERFAAIASVTGSITPSYINLCAPNRPVPVMEVHGTADFVVPYDGLASISLPVDTVVAFWVAHNGCVSPPTATPVPNTNISDGCTAIRYDYDNCDADAAVVFYKIFGGGHTWPGAPINVGVTNQDFDASVEIWRFFRRFRQSAVSGLPNLLQSEDIHLFPNPAGEELQLRLPESGDFNRYVLYNSTGVRVAQGVLNSPEAMISLAGLPEGVYVVQLSSKRGVVGKMFVKSGRKD